MCWSNFRLFIGLLEASSIATVCVCPNKKKRPHASSHCCKCCSNILQVHQVSFSSFPPFCPFKVHPRTGLWNTHVDIFGARDDLRCVASLETAMLPCPKTCQFDFRFWDVVTSQNSVGGAFYFLGVFFFLKNGAQSLKSSPNWWKSKVHVTVSFLSFILLYKLY